MQDASQRPRPSPEMWVCHLGLVPYERGVAMQERVRARRQAGEIADTLLLLEHPPTYTRGRRAGAEELPFPEDFYRGRGIAVHDTDRGGRVTYHGPGQLVGYPIMATEDVVAHVRTMERAIVAALGQVGVAAHARAQDGPDYTGVWVGGRAGAAERKIASIGVHVSRGVTTHGFAVNVDNDLEPFTWVVACGLPGVAMTSLARESRGECESLACFRRRTAHSFCQAHGRRQRLVSPGRLGVGADAAPLAGPAPATRRTPPAPVPA